MRLRSIVLSVATAIGILLTSASPAAAVDATTESNVEMLPTYEITVLHSGMCLKIGDYSHEESAPASQHPCAGLNDDWTAVPVDTNEFALRVGHSGKCLAIKNGWAVQQTCDYRDDQLWRTQQLTAETHLIISDLSGQCLDVKQASMERYAPVQQHPCHGNPNQQWTFTLI